MKHGEIWRRPCETAVQGPEPLDVKLLRADIGMQISDPEEKFPSTQYVAFSGTLLQYLGDGDKGSDVMVSSQNLRLVLFSRQETPELINLFIYL